MESLRSHPCRSHISVLLVVLLVLLSSGQYGCGGGGSVEDEGPPPPPPPGGVEVQDAVTPSSGYLELVSEVASVTVRLATVDDRLTPLGGIPVRMVADADQVVLYAYDPSGQYAPTLHSIDLGAGAASRVTGIETVALILLVVGVVSAIHEFATDPPRADVVAVGDGELTRCLVGDVNDVLAVLGIVGPVVGGKVAAIKYGSGVAKRVEVVIAAGALAADVAARLSEFMGQDVQTQICWNEELVGPDGHPFYVEIGPVEGSSVAYPPAGVNVAVAATGEITGHVADLTAENQTGEAQRILIYPGITFQNMSSVWRQNMTVIRTVSTQLEAGEQRTEEIRGACVNLDRGPPDPGDLFVPFAEQRPDLIALGQAIDRLMPADPNSAEYLEFEAVAQEAVWVITDGFPPYWEWQRVVELFIVAGLDPADYPALSGGYYYSREVPAKLLPLRLRGMPTEAQ